MFNPSDSSTNRIARLVILTHAVPAIASTNGSATSAMAISAVPTHFAAGCFLSKDNASIVRKSFENADERRCSADKRSSKVMNDVDLLEESVAESRAHGLSGTNDLFGQSIQTLPVLQYVHRRYIGVHRRFQRFSFG